MKGENQRVKATKQLLKEGLLRLLNKKDIDKINISELCCEAGVNRATFYRHYSIPQELLYEIENELIKSVPNFEAVPENAKQAEEMFLETCKYLYQNADTVRILIRNNSDKNLANIISKFYERAIREARSDAKWDMFDQYSIKVFTTFAIGGGYQVIRRWLLEDRDKTPEEVTHHVFTFVRYIFSAAGR